MRGRGVSKTEGVHDVLPSGGVSSAMQQAADQYYILLVLYETGYLF